MVGLSWKYSCSHSSLVPLTENITIEIFNEDKLRKDRRNGKYFDLVAADQDHSSGQQKGWDAK